MQPGLKLCSTWLSSAAALPSLPSCMKVSLTGHTVLVRLSVESLLTLLSSGMIAEVWGQPDFYSLAGFIFLLWSLCVYSCILCVSDFCLNKTESVYFPTQVFFCCFFLSSPKGIFCMIWKREKETSSNAFCTCPELGSKP